MSHQGCLPGTTGVCRSPACGGERKREEEKGKEEKERKGREEGGRKGKYVVEGMTERRDEKREEIEMKEERKEQENKEVTGEKEEDGVKNNTLTKDLKEKLYTCVHCAHKTVYNYNSHQQCREKSP